MGEARQTEEDSEPQSHLELLWDILELQLSDTLRTKTDYVKNGVITYESIWTIFEPGCLVFTIDDGHESLMQLTTRNFNSGFDVLNCQYVDWDGEQFGLASQRLIVGIFEGTSAITGLIAYPFEYHPGQNNLAECLIARGKVFQAHKGYHYGVQVVQRNRV